jgi:hypothetical protein
MLSFIESSYSVLRKCFLHILSVFAVHLSHKKGSNALILINNLNRIHTDKQERQRLCWAVGSVGLVNLDKVKNMLKKIGITLGLVVAFGCISISYAEFGINIANNITPSKCYNFDSNTGKCIDKISGCYFYIRGNDDLYYNYGFLNIGESTLGTGNLYRPWATYKDKLFRKGDHIQISAICNYYSSEKGYADNSVTYYSKQITADSLSTSQRNSHLLYKCSIKGSAANGSLKCTFR